MNTVHFVPTDDIQTNHSLYKCSCNPVVKEKSDINDVVSLEIYHRYTDKKGYIKEVCAELGISTPKFSYNQITKSTGV